MKEELARATGVLEKKIAGARWVPKENLHLTLSFLGRVDDGRIASISAATAEAVQGHVDFVVRLGELGAFPSARRARVVWAGLDDPTKGTSGLADSVGDAMEGLGFPRERRAFAPHVTLARLKMPHAIELDEAVAAIAFPIERVTLFESRLGRPNAVYTALATFPFRRGS